MATLVLDSVSLSTSIVTGAPVHVVRMVLDGLHLLLTPGPAPGDAGEGGGDAERRSRTVSSPSVCVMDVEWLELTLKHCSNALLNDDFHKVSYMTPSPDG